METTTLYIKKNCMSSIVYLFRCPPYNFFHKREIENEKKGGMCQKLNDLDKKM